MENQESKTSDEIINELFNALNVPLSPKTAKKGHRKSKLLTNKEDSGINQNEKYSRVNNVDSQDEENDENNKTPESVKNSDINKCGKDKSSDTDHSDSEKDSDDSDSSDSEKDLKSKKSKKDIVDVSDTAETENHKSHKKKRDKKKKKKHKRDGKKHKSKKKRKKESKHEKSSVKNKENVSEILEVSVINISPDNSYKIRTPSPSNKENKDYVEEKDKYKNEKENSSSTIEKEVVKGKSVENDLTNLKRQRSESPLKDNMKNKKRKSRSPSPKIPKSRSKSPVKTAVRNSKSVSPSKSQVKLKSRSSRSRSQSKLKSKKSQSRSRSRNKNEKSHSRSPGYKGRRYRKRTSKSTSKSPSPKVISQRTKSKSPSKRRSPSKHRSRSRHKSLSRRSLSRQRSISRRRSSSRRKSFSRGRSISRHRSASRRRSTSRNRSVSRRRSTSRRRSKSRRRSSSRLRSRRRSSSRHRSSSRTRSSSRRAPSSRHRSGRSSKTRSSYLRNSLDISDKTKTEKPIPSNDLQSLFKDKIDANKAEKNKSDASKIDTNNANESNDLPVWLDIGTIPTPSDVVNEKKSVGIESIPLPIPSPAAIPNPAFIPLPTLPSSTPDEHAIAVPILDLEAIPVPSVSSASTNISQPGVAVDVPAVPVIPEVPNEEDSSTADASPVKENDKAKQEEGEKKAPKTIIIKSLKMSIVYQQAQEEWEKKEQEEAKQKAIEEKEKNEREEIERKEQEMRNKIEKEIERKAQKELEKKAIKDEENREVDNVDEKEKENEDEHKNNEDDKKCDAEERLLNEKVLKFIDFERESSDVKKEHKVKKLKLSTKDSDNVEDPITDFIKQQIQTSILKKELERIGSRMSEEGCDKNDDKKLEEKKKDKLENDDNEKTEIEGEDEISRIDRILDEIAASDEVNGREEGEIDSEEEETEINPIKISKKKSKKDKEKDKSKKKDKDKDKDKEKGKEKRKEEKEKKKDKKKKGKEKNKEEKKKKKKDGDKSHSKSHSKSRSRSRSRGRSADKKSSRKHELDHAYRHPHHLDRDPERDRDRDRDRDSRSRRRRSRERSRDRSTRSNRTHNRYSRSRSRSRTRRSGKEDVVTELRDKLTRKRLLEIARRNAVYLMQNGSLPPSVEQEQLVKMKTGGKSVEELTDFCKQLVASGEYSDVELSDPEFSDPDNDQEKPFGGTRHPFYVKDRPILMNIRNAPMLPVKSNAERLADSSKLREQFPVSSGSHHRNKEGVWVPVEKDKDKKDKDEKEEEEEKVFPTKDESLKDVDIGSIVSNRLNAMRKLQDNPLDVEAMKVLSYAQKEMQSWAMSKQEPGQFTGSTGVKVLSQNELAGGHQAWARKEQFKEARPVASHFGLKMLQKMGWNPGEGLGKNKEGALEPLLLDVKLDKKGFYAQEELPTRNNKPPPPRQDTSSKCKLAPGKHPVSALVELCCKRKWNPPEFEMVFDCGPDHKKNFLMKVIVNNVAYKPSVAASTKKLSKANAAAACLQALGLIAKEPGNKIEMTPILHTKK